MHWLLFLFLVTTIIIVPIVVGAMQEQRWFKKLLFFHSPRYLRPISPRLKPVQAYFNKLSKEKKREFNWRVYYFLDTTRIDFRNFKPNQLINYNAVRYLIASVATQMTLFLTEDCFDAFNRILVYPEEYYSPITKKYHKGETNPSAGLIVLSWKSFKEGFQNSGDGVNLLIHELAHALWLENKFLDYEIFSEDAFSAFEQQSAELLSNGRESTFLRRYAFRNEEEFFAVVVENFFERPHEFKRELPILYSSVVNLFRQDPSEYLQAV